MAALFRWNVAAQMLRVDMKAAKVEPVDEKGHVADFHSLRVTYVTNLVGATHDLVLVQRLARLSTVLLLNRYAKPHDSLRRDAIAKLPELEVVV